MAQQLDTLDTNRPHLRRVVAGEITADPTSFFVPAYVDVLRWIETGTAHDYWVVQWTAVLERVPGALLQDDDPARWGAPPRGLPAGFGTADRMAFVKSLGRQQGLRPRETKDVAKIASAAEQTLAVWLEEVAKHRDP